MNKEKINWCLKQTKGIELIELKPHLSKSYIEEADKTLENVFFTKGKWKLITAYYSCYSALYSLLMKCGIKCEIHDCSLELMELFGFEPNEIDYFKKLKKDRIQAQYYLKDIVLENVDDVKKFILKCKTILDNLDSDKIEKIRGEIKGLNKV